jgi:carbamoyl-phosphate synthase large subunit
VARQFDKLGFKIKATNGTHRFLSTHGIESQQISKIYEGRPNIVDAIKNDDIQLVINTPSGRLSKHDDSYIRKAAIKYKVPYITTLAAALAAAKGIASNLKGHGKVKSLQEYHKDIKSILQLLSGRKREMMFFFKSTTTTRGGGLLFSTWKVRSC